MPYMSIASFVLEIKQNTDNAIAKLGTVLFNTLFALVSSSSGTSTKRVTVAITITIPVRIKNANQLA